MIAPLNEIIGLPPATPPIELACAAERCEEALFVRAAGGDESAQHELVELRVALLIWAYANRAGRQLWEYH